MEEAPPSEQQYWIAEMDAAASAAEQVRNGAEQSIRSRHSNDSARSTRAPLIVAVNNGGVIQWQRDDWNKESETNSWSSPTKSPSREEVWKM